MRVPFWSKKAVLTVYLPLLLNYVFHFKIGFEAFSLAINSIMVLSARLKCPLIKFLSLLQPTAVISGETHKPASLSMFRN